MRATEREAIRRLECRLRGLFTRYFGPPSDLRWGDPGAVGDDTRRLDDGTLVPLLSRRDHVHGLQPFDRFANHQPVTAYFLDDFLNAGAASDGLIQYNNGGSGSIRDQAGALGAMGMHEENCGDAGAGERSSGYFVACGTDTAGVNETTEARSLIRRLRVFEARGRFTQAGSNEPEQNLADFPNGALVRVGGLRTSTNQFVRTTTVDGIFWEADRRDGVTQDAYWHAVVMRDGTRIFDEPTGLAINVYTGEGGTHPRAMHHQTIGLTHDGRGNVSFTSDGIDVLAATGRRPCVIPDNLLVKKLCGWGVWVAPNVNAPTLNFNGWSADYLRLEMARVCYE